MVACTKAMPAGSCRMGSGPDAVVESEPATDEPVEPVVEAAAQSVAEEEPPVNSLEALMRRRGVSTVAHVEEVEVTDRGGRG